jgi:NAD(P)H-quinone oxidoreductase subunit 5
MHIVDLDRIGELCLTGALGAPLAGAVAAAAGGVRGLRAAAHLGWTSALLAVVAAGVVALRGPYLAAADTGGHVVLGLWADQLTVTLVVVVCVVGAVIQSFSLRYLESDRTARRFFAAAHVVVSAMAIVCASATAAVLVGAWVVAGAAFVTALGCRPDLPGVKAATRRTLRMFVVGDLAAVAALVVVWLRAGDVDLAAPGALRSAAAHLGDLVTPVALLVAVAVLTRSAQGPLGRWLPGTVSAPTPTSVLLHAGVVNGGGVLLVRFGVLVGGSMLAMVGVCTVAAITAVVATQAMTRKADVKGALALSTMGQMGFMVAECTVGAYLAAIVHLIGHALYKAALFFGSGAQVPRPGDAPLAPVAVMPNVARGAASALAVSTTVAVMAAVPHVLDHRGAFVLLVFAAGTAASASWSWWGRAPVSVRGAFLWATALLGACGFYGLVLVGLGRWIGPSLPPVGAGVLSPWWLVAVAGTAVAAAALGRLPSVRMRFVAVLVDAAAPPAVGFARANRGTELVARAEVPWCGPALVGAWEEGAA